MDLKTFWALRPEQKCPIVDKAFPKPCTHKTLNPVKCTDKFSHCSACGQTFEIVTPYVVKAVEV